MIDNHKVEVLKVWYSVFCTLMDGNDADDQLLIKLRQLRQRLMTEYPALEKELQRGRI